ncbi:protein of unknown function [Thermococcus nautili]|uniref:glycosyltransferase family 2 protein n=1 Tax=Thermococcus nautili TaxID=195522 RepID=UPI0025550ED4|nr:glycosyltransferase family 2 protein [Thermococcus nautili]CAI1492439.1 protein of unknown function [Thermococcus nautili]
MMYPHISIIILNWNGWRDTIECLESVYQLDYPYYDVIVVDNGSKDESIQRIKEYCEGKIKVNSRFIKYNSINKPIKIFEVKDEDARKGKFKYSLYRKYEPNRRLILIKNRENYGFSGGNNIGIKFALEVLDPDYILLLNNDTVVHRNFLKTAISIAKMNEKIGMISTKILFYDNPRIINSVGTIIFKDGSAAHLGGRELDNGQYNRIFETFAPCAAAAFYRKEMLKEIGLFDEDLFLYMEDVDLGWRARLMGWKCFYSPNSIVYHKHSVSSGKYSRFKLYYIERNRLLVLIKNYPIKYLILFPIYNLHKYIVLLLSKSCNQDISNYNQLGILPIFTTIARAWIDAIRHTPKFILKRHQIMKQKRVNSTEIDKWFRKFSKSLFEVVCK